MEHPELVDLYIKQWLPRSEVANRLHTSIHSLKRLLSKLGISKKRWPNCVECGRAQVRARARCRRCYRKMPDVAKKIRDYKYRTRDRTNALSRERRRRNPALIEYERRWKSSASYKEYTRRYNERYRQSHGQLKRPAFYWQNRWTKIQESKGCRLCKSGENLEAHHIVPISQATRLGWPEKRIHSIENLDILCRSCHRGPGHSKLNHGAEH